MKGRARSSFLHGLSTIYREFYGFSSHGGRARARGERAFDIFSRLLKDNIIFIGTPIDDQIAN
jgi:hypothetical protein